MNPLFSHALALSLLCYTHTRAESARNPTQTSPTLTTEFVPEPRIVGGEVVQATTWITSIGNLNSKNKYDHVCGGTLIAPDWVLTAAHCFDTGPSEPQANYVYVGGQDLRRPNTFKKARIEEVTVHPGWYSEADVNDIAVVRLATPIDNTPITLNANTSLDVPGGTETTPVALGWGDLKDRSHEGTDVLHGVELPLVPYKRCEVIYGYQPGRKTRLCAGGVYGKDTCQGDSGGPLVLGEGSDAVQIGLVAFGGKCGANPAVYTRVSSYLSWLKSLGIPFITN
eukprot:comp77222_c0_seq1/m.48267 comp77222_c0_seq1/g.48267  ORF comp77222_c0_seq1/g.48267 comp77222_c0_seq1/m.48267 type:complete len:282 (-) comp77222_c0_seq1:676-1521(-)